MKKNQATRAQILEAQAAHPSLDHRGLSKLLGVQVSEPSWRGARAALPAAVKQARKEALQRERYEVSKTKKVEDLLDKNPCLQAPELHKKLGEKIGLRTIERVLTARNPGAKRKQRASSRNPKAAKQSLGIFQTLYSKRAQFQHEQLATVSEIVDALNRFAGTRLEVVYLTHPLPTLEIRNNQSR